MHVHHTKATLAQMLLHANATDFISIWTVLKTFCQIPVEAYQNYLPEEQFSWEFHLGEVPERPEHFVAAFSRSIAFNGITFVEECFCSISMEYDLSLAMFYEPEVIEGFDFHHLETFFATSERSRGFQKACLRLPHKVDLHQASL